MLGNSQFAIACGLGMKIDNIRFQSDLISQDSIFILILQKFNKNKN